MTYSLLPRTRLPGLGLLAVSKQVRSEAEPIFYGENTFRFTGIPVIVPFLKDRSMTACKHIRHLDLTMQLDQYQQQEWKTAFRYISLHIINLRQLDVTVLNAELPPSHQAVDFQARDNDWVHALTQIRDLDSLRFYLAFVGIEESIDLIIEEGTNWGEDDSTIQDNIASFEDWVYETEKGYRKHLKRKMLRECHKGIDGWLAKHKCNLDCDKVRQGRAAIKPGLPPSETKGQWTLPKIDLDALYKQENSLNALQGSTYFTVGTSGTSDEDDDDEEEDST
ncbi:MAG: hypothetical protein Q9222_003341 [Ikaeria aurantiellina]